MVGTEKVPFIVHEKQLCEKSAFFRAAFGPHFKEGSSRVIVLEEDDADTIDHFIQFLYSNRKDDEDLGLLDNHERHECMMAAMRLFVFGDKYDVPEIRDYSITWILENYGTQFMILPSTEIIEFVYANTSQGSMVRKFVADWWAFEVEKVRSGGQVMQDWLVTVPEFAVDLAMSLAAAAAEDDDDAPFRQNWSWP